MKQHTYTVTLKHELDAKGEPVTEDKTLELSVKNHDDIFQVIEKMKNFGHFDDPEEATRFALGLKLFGEVILENKGHPLFEELGPQFGAFMKKLKKGAQPR